MIACRQGLSRGRICHVDPVEAVLENARKLTLAWRGLLACASIAWAQGSEQLVEKVKSSVVQVNIGKGSLGSGCVVDAEKGIIATNYHVIASAVD